MKSRTCCVLSLIGPAGFAAAYVASAIWLGGKRRRLDAEVRRSVERQLLRAKAAAGAAYSSSLSFDEATTELLPLRKKLLRLASAEQRELIRGRSRREIAREEREQERKFLARVGEEELEMRVAVAPQLAEEGWIADLERKYEETALKELNSLVRWALDDELAEDNGEIERERVTRFLKVAGW